jgi:glycosyltransferase involved in cell wall biosynthesis
VGDADALGAAVIALLTDPARRAAVAAAGRARADVAHRLDDAARRFLAVIDGLVAGTDGDPTRPFRVVFLNENVGGHATVHLHLARVLGERTDVDARFVHVPRPGPVRRAVGVRIPGLTRLDLDGQSLRAQLAAAVVAGRLLRRAVADGEIDALHVYTANAALTSTAVMRRIPTVVTSDSTNALNAYRLPTRLPTRHTRWTVAASRPFERRVLDAARLLVANSRWVADSWRDDYDVEDSRVRILPFGIVAPLDLPLGAAPGTRAERPTLVFVGRQLERKGGLQLHRVHQQHFADRADLVFVTTEAVPAGRSVRVIDDIVPGDGRLWDVLRAASVFVFPSTIDQSPNAVLEAMAAGLPVVAARTGALGEMVPDGECGLLVPVDDDEALAHAVGTLLDDPDARVRMGAAAQARQRAHYDMRIVVDDLVAGLRAVSRRPRYEEETHPC